MATAVPLGLVATATTAHAESSPSPSPSAGHNASGGPIGPGCSSLPNKGKLADEPVGKAVARTPNLVTLSTAIHKARLNGTLDKAKNITVFAPDNAAFKKLSKTQLTKLLSNRTQLAKVVKYHVVTQTVTPKQLAHGSFTTMEGQKITTSGSGQSFTVNKTAKVKCGNIKTLNATVYLVDSVLQPPK